jgi:hypothetical protein
MSAPVPIPMPLRAAAGLAAVAIDEARRLPGRLVGLPVTAVGAALQVSLKAQQRYADLVARGDELLGQLRGTEPGTPAWARFDEDEVPLGARAPSPFDAAGRDDVLDGADLADDVLDEADPADDLLDTLAAELDPITVVATDGAGPALDLVDDPLDGPVEEEIDAVADDVSRYDGYLSGPPLAGYDAMSIPQLRARLRTLSEPQLAELVAYERATAERPPYLTMLENRLATVRGR